MDLQAIKTVVAIDTASFDINRLMIELGSFVERRQHIFLFGDDEEVWRQSSPAQHVNTGKHISAFAILYAASSEGDVSTLALMAFIRAKI